MRPVVELYGRPGCHLCDEARAAVLRVAERVPLELVEIDVESDDQLLARYLERIPVTVVAGEELFDFVVDEDALVSALSSAHP